MIKRTLSKLGFQLLKSSEALKYPYLRKFDFADIHMQYWIPDDTAKDWYDTNMSVNSAELGLLYDLISPNDSILEIGVHYGVFATFMCMKLGPHGKYTGVELQASSAMYAQAQLHLNGLPAHFSIINAAGSSRSGTIDYLPSLNGNALIGSCRRGQRIRAVTGDEIARESKITLLKIDVEGFEIDVLRGCQRILASRPKLALELHGPLINNFGCTLDDVFKLIDFDTYVGHMFVRPNFDSLWFDPALITRNAITNVFLTPIEQSDSSGK